MLARFSEIAHSRKFQCCFFLVSIVVALIWLAPRVAILISPPSEPGLVQEGTIPFEYGCLFLCCAYLLTLPAAMSRLPKARIVLLLLLFVMASHAMLESFLWANYVFEQGESNHFQPASEIFWALMDSMRWAGWFFFNYWFFTGWGKERRQAEVY